MLGPQRLPSGPTWWRARPAWPAAWLVSAAAACALAAGCSSTTSSAASASRPSVPASGASSPSPTATSGPAAGHASCAKIGVLLPNTSEPRWQQLDGPLLTSLITAQVPGAAVTVDNADGSAATQLSQATADLSAGDCALVVSPADPVGAAAIVTRAAARKVPVISYDQLIQSKDTSYVVAFDQALVGRLQGQYIIDHYKDYVHGSTGNTVMINGSPQSAGSVARHGGAISQLTPLFDARTLQRTLDQFTPGDSPAAAQTLMQEALTASQNNVQVAYAADDGLADGVILALRAKGLGGKVLVTGAGATVTGLQHILIGDQAMTVETNPRLEADATARLVGSLARGADTAALVNGSLGTADSGTVPAVLEKPFAIDKTNISQVIADGLVTKAQLCAGLPAGTNTFGACA